MAAEAQARAGSSPSFSSSIVCSTQALAPSAFVRLRSRSLKARSVSSRIRSKLWVGPQFRVLYDRIDTPGGGTILFAGMADHTAESIKSLENCRIAWVEEAQTLSHRSLALLRPTIRAENSELWFSWNPRRKSDAVDQFLRGEKPDNAIVVKANWRDNPWFPSVLEEE
jgi:phage terminase large subunit